MSEHKHHCHDHSSHKHHNVKKLLKSSKNLRWRRPQINLTPEGEERKVYRLDLFFDLVFVIAIGQLAHMFHGSITWKVVAEFIILFVPVRWIWVSATYYTARFEELTVRHRVYMFALMIPVIGMGYAIHGGLGEHTLWYIGSYVLAKLLLARMRHIGGKSQQQSTDLETITSNMMRSNIIMSATWIGSLFVPPPLRYLLWFATMIGELVRSYSYRSTPEDDVPDFDLGHLTERFGLFTIIVLAEIIIGVFSGLSELDQLTMNTVITSIATFFIACVLWRIYFDFIMYRPLKKQENANSKLFLWTYGHLPLTLSITLLGGSLTHIIYMTGDHLELIPVRTVMASLCIVLLTIGYLGSFHEANDTHGHVDMGDDDWFNCHIARAIIRVVGLLLLRTLLFTFLHFPLHRFMIGVVVLVSGLALEGLIHRIEASNANEPI